jgi:hypothetical protein
MLLGVARGSTSTSARPARRYHVGGNRRQHIADEVDVLGGEEAAPRGVVGELPGLLGNPRHHRREDEIELAPVLARTRLVIEPPDVALEQGLEEIGAERDQFLVLRKRALVPVGVRLDAFVHVDDGAEARVLLARVGVEPHRDRDPRPAVGRKDPSELLPPGRGRRPCHVGFEPVHDDDVEGVAVHGRRREAERGNARHRRVGERRRRCTARNGGPLPSDRVASRFGNRVDLRGELVVLGRDVLAARNRLAVLRDLRRDLVAHDRVRIALRRAHDGSLRERSQDLLDRLLRGPALGAVEVGNGLAAVDLLDQIGAHVLVLEAQRVAGFMTDHAPEFSLRRAHRKALEVEGRLVFVDAEDLGADVRPVPRQFFRRVEPGDTHLTHACGLHEVHVGGLRPRIHVQQDAGAQIARRIVEELHREPDAVLGPLVPDQYGEPPRPTASANRRSRQYALFIRICRIDLDAATENLSGLLGRQRPRPADNLGHE